MYSSRCCLLRFCKGPEVFCGQKMRKDWAKSWMWWVLSWALWLRCQKGGVLSELRAISAHRSHLLRGKRSTFSRGGTRPNRKSSLNNSLGRKRTFVCCVFCFHKSDSLLFCKLWCELMNLPRRAVWLPVASELLHKHGFSVLHDDGVDIRMKTEIQSVWLSDEWEARLQN